MEKTSEFLIYLMACSLQGTKPEEALLANIDLEALLRLAKAHSVSAMVCMTLEQTDAFQHAADLPQLLQKFLGIRLGRRPVYIVFRHNGIHQCIQGAFLLESLENKAAQLIHGNQAVDFRRAGTGRHQNILPCNLSQDKVL